MSSHKKHREKSINYRNPRTIWMCCSHKLNRIKYSPWAMSTFTSLIERYATAAKLVDLFQARHADRTPRLFPPATWNSKYPSSTTDSNDLGPCLLRAEPWRGQKDLRAASWEWWSVLIANWSHPQRVGGMKATESQNKGMKCITEQRTPSSCGDAGCSDSARWRYSH